MIDVYAWGWPQFTYLVICLVGIGVCAARHGKTELKTHSLWSDIFCSVPSWGLLICGGFFS